MNVCVRGKGVMNFFLKTYIFHIPYYEVKTVLKIIYKIMEKILEIFSSGSFLKGRVQLFTWPETFI